VATEVEPDGTLINQITGEIIRRSLHIHSKLGPGLLESAYHACLAHDLIRADLLVESELLLPVIYEKLRINAGYRIDLLVEKLVIVEIKSVEQILPVHLAQLLTYLRLAQKRVGLLINFNVSHLRQGVKRVVNHF
jgi:GxxExxY protein